MLQYGIQGFHLAQLRAVRVPALVLWGAHDTVDQVAAGRRSAHALHAPFDLVAGAGHLSMLGAPGAIAGAIERFARSRALDRARIKTFRTAFAVPAVGSVHLRKKAE
jgi:pimeloyl-ACP methyl ester carboxylesterase